MRLLCRVMRVSESAYHAYRSGKTHVMSAAKAERAGQVKEVFDSHRRRYGSRRIAAELKAQHISIGRFAVRTLMRRQKLEAIARRRFVPRTTDSRHGAQASPNLLREKANAPQGPREVIVGDITYSLITAPKATCGLLPCAVAQLPRCASRV